MKFKYSLTVGLFASVVILGSCNDKKQGNNKPKTKTKEVNNEKVFDVMGNPVVPTPGKPAPVVPGAPVKPEPKPEPKSAPKKETLGPEIPVNYVRTEEKLEKGSVEDLAKKSGYAAFLPKDTEVMFSLQGVDKMIAKFMTSDLRKAIDLFAPEGRSIELEMKEDRDFKELMSVVGEEVFFAAGNNSAAFLKNAVEGITVMQSYQIKGALKMMLSFVDDEIEPDHRGQQQQLMEFFKSKDGMLKYLKKMNVAPMYAGFKVSDKEKREKFLKMLVDGSQEPVKFQPEGAKAFTSVKSNKGNGFTGFHINGAELIKLMGEREQAQAEQMLGKAGYELLKAEVSKKEFTYMVGSVGDYIVFYAGANVDGLQIVNTPSESVLANPEMAFATNYADKDISFLGYISKEVTDSFQEMSSGYADIFKALSEVLEETESFGDTRELRDLLLKFGEKEKALFALSIPARFGMVGYFEDGYKLDTYLGAESAYSDLDSNRKLAAMANHKDAFISANWISNTKTGEIYMDYIESLFNILYKGTKVATDLEVDDSDWIEFTSTFRMFDAEFSDDLLRIWNALKTGSAGLGNETAFMADLKGRMPRVPKVPSVVLDNGPIPRFAIAKHVTDRKKLSVAWDDIAVAAKDIAGGVSKLARKDIALPKPERMKKGGLDIWSYQLGITTSESNLALGLNDKIFFLTTSPNYIAVRADELESKEAVKGAEFVIRAAPLRVAAEKWFTLIEKNGEDLMDEFSWNDFKENKTKIKALIDASKQMEKIDIYTRKVDGEIRNTIHFHTNK